MFECYSVGKRRDRYVNAGDSAAMTKKVDQFEVRAADGREFNVTVWQEYEERAVGRGKTRMVPSIQVMETDEGYYVRRTDDDRLLICGLNIYANRIDQPAELA